MTQMLAGPIILVLGASTAGLAETAATPDAGWQAAGAFRDACLATRGQGLDGAVAAILSRPGVKEGPNLPAYGGGEPMRTFADGKLEFLVRPGKGAKYVCFVAVQGGDDLVASVKSAVEALPGLQPKPVKAGKKVFFEWLIADSKDEIRLTPKSSVGAILINLEVQS